MANTLDNIQFNPAPTDHRTAVISSNSLQSWLVAGRQCVKMVDDCLARAPGGTAGLLDDLCAMTNGAARCQEYYDVYKKGLELVNAFKTDDADPDLLEQFTQADVDAAIARMP